MNVPCQRLQKRDLIKVGRVRFKIREMMSPQYAQIEHNNDFRSAHYREMYPSINDVSSVSHSIIDDSHAQDDQQMVPAQANNQINAGIDIEEAAANALLTESDDEDDLDIEGHPTNRLGIVNSQTDQRNHVGMGLGENTGNESQLINEKKINVGPSDEKLMAKNSKSNKLDD